MRPAYLAIAAALREELVGVAAHSALPSERVLAERHGVSRMTARQAVRQLEQEGVVYRRVPNGTFVAEPRLALRIGSFTDEVVSAGHDAAAELLDATTHRPNPAVREALELRADEEVHELRRLRRVDGEPVAIETTAVPVRLCPDRAQLEVPGSLWAVLRQGGVRPDRAAATLEVVTADDAIAPLLGIQRGAPVIALDRLTRDAEGRPFEAAHDLYRADRVRFAVEVGIPSAPG